MLFTINKPLYTQIIDRFNALNTYKTIHAKLPAYTQKVEEMFLEYCANIDIKILYEAMEKEIKLKEFCLSKRKEISAFYSPSVKEALEEKGYVTDTTGIDPE